MHAGFTIPGFHVYTQSHAGIPGFHMHPVPCWYTWVPCMHPVPCWYTWVPCMHPVPCWYTWVPCMHPVPCWYTWVPCMHPVPCWYTWVPCMHPVPYAGIPGFHACTRGRSHAGFTVPELIPCKHPWNLCSAISPCSMGIYKTHPYTMNPPACIYTCY